MEATNIPVITPVHGKNESSAEWKKCIKSSLMCPQDLKISVSVISVVSVSRNFWPSKVQYIFEIFSTVKSLTMSKYRESRKAEIFRQMHCLTWNIKHYNSSLFCICSLKHNFTAKSSTCNNSTGVNFTKLWRTAKSKRRKFAGNWQIRYSLKFFLVNFIKQFSNCRLSPKRDYVGFIAQIFL